MQEENKNKKSFHQGMKTELKKVVWPTGKQVVKSTLATISFVLLISVILIVFNYAFSFINTKWFDLVLGRKTNNTNQEQIINKSGDALESGDIISKLTSGESGESNTNVESGE